MHNDMAYPWAVNMIGTADDRVMEWPAQPSPAAYKAQTAKLVSEKRMKPGDEVTLLYSVFTGFAKSRPYPVGKGTIFPGGDYTLQYAVDGKETWTVATEATKGKHLVVVYNASFDVQHHTLPNPYFFETEETAQPRTLA